MGEITGIEWCDHTFNPWVGCTKISPACEYCYAERVGARLGVVWGELRRRTAASTWQQPLAWDRKAARDGVRRRVFCASLADVFDNQVPPEWRADLWQVIKATPHLDWLLLTKRPQNITGMVPWDGLPSNVWLGTTVETQAEAARRIPHLLSVPAAVRFLSCEPLLGPVDLAAVIRTAVLDGIVAPGAEMPIGWVIAGGESGPGARPSHPDWLHDLWRQCTEAGVPFFFKQWGDWGPLWGLPTTVQAGDAIIAPDGRYEILSPQLGTTLEGIGTPMRRFGKKVAGSLLHRRSLREWPR